MSDWITRAAALATLGVRDQTLYAYVSRGLVERRPDPADPRRSLYRAGDIATLRARRDRGRGASAVAAGAIAWGEPTLPTTISTVLHGRLIYRGHEATMLADSATLEEVAALLWLIPAVTPAAGPARPLPGESRDPVPSADLGPGLRRRSEASDPFAALAALAPTAPTTIGRAPTRLVDDASDAVAALHAALGVPPGPAPVHVRLAHAWGCDPDPVRRALVLLADHELNPSTFAVRVAAATGASVAASLLAGLAALSGPRHGGAGGAVLALLDDAARSGTAVAVERWLPTGLPGFGHPLYPAGDARAAALLARVAPDPAMTDLAAHVRERTDATPNIDFALAALTRAHALPPDAPFRLFAIARLIGWAAHAIEQAGSTQTIRPRARYIGPMPD